MARGNLCVPALFLFSLCLVFLPAEPGAEFYKYTDKEGVVHFVDDESKIPKEYRGRKKAYKEKYDDLTEEERIRALQKEREELDAIRKKEQEERDAYLQRMEEWEALRRKEEAERAARRKEEEERRKRMTRIAVMGNQVIVPVTLEHRGNHMEALLLLDTGAELTALHDKIAARLNIEESETDPIAMITAAGRTVPARLAKLDYVRVGPVERRDLDVVIIPYKGPSLEIDGLLGMNFLRELQYKIDFEKRMIEWKP